MTGNVQPIFSKVGDFQFGNVMTAAANDFTGLGLNNVVLFTADETNGGFIQRLRCKAIGTNVASVIRLFINNGSGRLASAISAVSGTPTGTPSASGGTLASGNYFAKIVAYDQYGVPTAASTETASVSVTGPTGSITWNWTAVTGAVSYRIHVGSVTTGQITYFTASTNSYVQTAPLGATGTRDSLGPGSSNNCFYDDFSLPSTTLSANSGTTPVDIPLNFALPPGFRIIGGLGTAVAAGWQISAIAGKY